MKNILLWPLAIITLVTTISARAECSSDNADFCSIYAKAEQGLAQAQFNLGWAYANGEGITQDKRKAVSWYQKAAAQGGVREHNGLVG